jgi:signal transduction histidine kinase
LAQALVEKSVETVHELSRDLRPDLLDILGFIPSLRELLKGFLKDTGVRASLTVFSGIEKLNETIRTALYRVIQEALSNVARHAQASLVEIRIQKEGAFVVMEIVDNGKGFSRLSTPKSPKKSRLGLIGMQERIEMLDGTFKVEGRAGNGMGTTVTAKVPYK